MVLRVMSTQVKFLKYVWQRLSRIKVLTMILMAGALFLLHVTSHKIYINKNELPATHPWIFRPSWAYCLPKTNIAFLKSHKCASSAIQNILFRYGYYHNLSFALPETGNYFGGGWMPFHRDMVRATPWHMLGSNILAIHMKWDHQQVSSLMPNDTIYLSIVREPSEMFESLFTFTKMEKYYSKNLEEFVATEEADMPRYKRYLGYNQMTWDFGLQANQINNLTAVREMVEKADKEFDLVMVAERMDESLVLMSHLLCWELTDVIVLKINARMEKFKKSLDTDTKKTLRKKLASDYLLYNYFVRRLDQLVEAYGKERMKKDVEILRAATAELYNTCSFKEAESGSMQGSNKPWSDMVLGYSSQRGNRKCEQVSRSEFSFINLLRGRQLKEAISKFGSQAKPSMGVPVGALALDNTGNMMDQVKKLQRILVHNGPEESVEGNISLKSH